MIIINQKNPFPSWYNRCARDIFYEKKSKDCFQEYFSVLVGQLVCVCGHRKPQKASSAYYGNDNDD